MARVSKGQQVKTFKHGIPQADQSSVDEVVKVYFDANSGEFRIFVPEHVAAALPRDALSEVYGATDLGRFVASKTLDDAKEAFSAVLKRYRNLIRGQGAVKVIRAVISADGHKHRGYNPPFGFNGAGGFGGRGVRMDYEILWRSGNRLYTGRYEDENLILQDKGALPGQWDKNYVLLDWTEDRETFFASMKKAVGDMADALIAFVSDDVEAKIELALAGPSPLALAFTPHEKP